MNPVATMPEMKHFPAQRWMSAKRIPAGDIHTSALFELQKAIAEARFDLIAAIVTSGQVTVAEPTVRIIIEITQETVDAEATGGEHILMDDPSRGLNRIMSVERAWATV